MTKIANSNEHKARMLARRKRQLGRETPDSHYTASLTRGAELRAIRRRTQNAKEELQR
jgi:hypothetical protein